MLGCRQLEWNMCVCGGDQDAAWGLQIIPKVAEYLTCAARPSAWALKLSEPNPHFTGLGQAHSRC